MAGGQTRGDGASRSGPGTKEGQGADRPLAWESPMESFVKNYLQEFHVELAGDAFFLGFEDFLLGHG